MSASGSRSDPSSQLNFPEMSPQPEEEAPPSKDKTRTKKAGTAETMAGRQREISVSEFFSKNRHLLGFDNPRKALLTTVKEAVDNSLDACEDAGILPTLKVEVEKILNDLK